VEWAAARLGSASAYFRAYCPTIVSTIHLFLGLAIAANPNSKNACTAPERVSATTAAGDSGSSAAVVGIIENIIREAGMHKNIKMKYGPMCSCPLFRMEISTNKAQSTVPPRRIPYVQARTHNNLATLAKNPETRRGLSCMVMFSCRSVHVTETPREIIIIRTRHEARLSNGFTTNCVARRCESDLIALQLGLLNGSLTPHCRSRLLVSSYPLEYRLP
jgi:hypothetical protein